MTRRATDLDDGALRWHERALLRLHLFMCVDCRRYVAQLRLVRQQAAALARDPAPGELHARVRDWFTPREP